MKGQFLKFWQDEEGATAIEYALIAGLVAVALITVLGADGLSGALSEIFGKITTELNTAAGVPAA